MLLILSSKKDEHVPLLLPHLEKRGARIRWIDAGDFPCAATISVRYTQDGLERVAARYDGEALDLADVTAVWYRRPSQPGIDDRITAPDHRRCVEEVSEALLLGLADMFADARWLPGTPRAVFAASNKVEQLAHATRVGLRPPRTLITNDPGELARFYEECNGRLITKPVRALHGVYDADGSARAFYARPLRRRDLHNAAALRYAPMILQEYVPKRAELRVTVVGERVFAAEIDSQASRATQNDWRHYDVDRTSYRAHDLPESVHRSCVRLVASYGLRYGALDLVLTPSGEYVFLELNPNGQWGFIEYLTGMPIADALADELLDSAAPSPVPAHRPRDAAGV
jgi:hypothetical protein